MTTGCEEALQKQIVDRIIARRRRTKWTFGGGVGICFMSTFNAGGQRFGVTVWQEFEKWIGTEKHFTYRINVCDASTISESMLRYGVCAGPLVFETTYRAGELFEAIDQPRLEKIKKQMIPNPQKEFSLLETLKRILSSI